MGRGFGPVEMKRGRRPGATLSVADTLVCLGGQGAPPTVTGLRFRLSMR
jgi:hypothetical protein